jgi:hypothetical protein
MMTGDDNGNTGKLIFNFPWFMKIVFRMPFDVLIKTFSQ